MNNLIVDDAMQVVKEKNGRMLSINAEEKQIFSGIQMKIMKSLAEGEKYPKEIARELRINEQKIYYHVRRLERRGFVSLSRKEERSGALAKLYALSSPAFVARFGEFKESKRIPRSGFEPFVRNGLLDGKIIVGSPDPHGPEKARSRDVSFAVDLALFLGTFLTRADHSVIEDKNVRAEDLRSNLIVVGGPITNKITRMVNEKLPVKFDSRKNIQSKRKIYRGDDCGFIAGIDNPFEKGKKVLVLAGKRYSGTKAAVLAFTRIFETIEKRSYTVVEGLDNDGDGEIDDIKILE